MQLKSSCIILIFLTFGVSRIARSQDKGLEIDFLSRYYDQSGDHSAVTGGEGTENLQAASPVLSIDYANSMQWVYHLELGVENVTSASLDRIDYFESAPGVNLSSASRNDNRAFAKLGFLKQISPFSLGASLGFSQEFDYRSINGGVNGSVELNQKLTTLEVGFNYYDDSLKLIDIYGFNEGEGKRRTADYSLSLTQVFSKIFVGSLEWDRSDQKGVLSSPFQEVHFSDGEIEAERLPSTRIRDALSIRANYAFTPNIIQRIYFRYYEDTWDIKSGTVESESHFLLPTTIISWIYPFFRYYSQDGTPYFKKMSVFNGDEEYFSSDWDLSTFDSYKLGIGFKQNFEKSGLSRWSLRMAYYHRQDGLNSFSLAGGLGWSF